MMFKLIVFYVNLLLCSCAFSTEDNIVEFENKRYSPSWDDLDTRPLPKWFDEAKVGIFIHWGVFSVPSFGSEWFWYNWKSNNSVYNKFIKKNYPPEFTYQDFAHDFKAEFFDPLEWASLFEQSGAKYVVLTSKHHEGFTLWPSKRSFSWNSVDIGPKRDIVKELSLEVRKQGLKFGLYHSLYEWFNPMYMEDRESLFSTQYYVFDKVWPDIKQLIIDYEPSVLWSDGDWEALDTYWNSTELLAWLYNESPVRDEIVVNDRWGIGVMCKHGDFYTCSDRYNPGVLQPHKWENCFTIDKKSWGYRRNAALTEYLTSKELIYEVVTTVSCGGNVLINVGPTKEGVITPIFQERLLTLGKWLKINGEGIYNTVPWVKQNDTHSGESVWYTYRKTHDSNIVYAITTSWPDNDNLHLKDITKFIKTNTTTMWLLNNTDLQLNWKIMDNSITEIKLPNIVTLQGRYAWTIKIIL